ncbi:MAG: HrcA family transcriptional regulator, partial [Parcubacteria group bacterium]|nr:HrcA family transcriptional regulator [Parcubacteria group bacterium]
MITARREKLLNFIIKEYVKTAKPVGSALVAKKGDFDLGSASLRSEMCELEQAGYLSQLHTSGGRVPTDKAYRYFVNNLIQNDDFEPASDEKRKIKTAVSSTDNPRRLNQGIARV